MARKSKQDTAKAKAAKQKKIAIGGGVLLVLLLAIQVPRTMKMMNGHAAPPVVSSTTPEGTTTTTVAPATPSDPNSLAAPTLAGAPTATTTAADTSDLVAAVPLKADQGQLETFQRFATKDPFDAQISADGKSVSASSGSGSGSRSGSGSGAASSARPAKSGGGGSTTTTVPITTTKPSAPSSQPPAPAPTTAVISLNGELSSVTVNSDFPTTGATFLRVGAIFHLISLTAKTAKIGITGGSYADGSGAITLHLKQPLTLQNTADGSKYTLILEPADTPVTASTSASAAAPTTAAPAASVPAVPSGSGG